MCVSFLLTSYVSFFVASHWKSQLGSKGYRRQLSDHHGSDEDSGAGTFREERYANNTLSYTHPIDNGTLFFTRVFIPAKCDLVQVD